MQPVLVVDVGGSRVKALASGEQEPRRFDSGPKLGAAEMMQPLLELVAGWSWELVSIGVPTQVAGGHIVSEPVNLGSGWVGFDFTAAFGKPTRVVNDAAMQALGSYDGGKMLFLGFGTGLGSALVADGFVQPMELGHLPFRKKTYEDYVGERGLEKYGKKRWRKDVLEVISALSAALGTDYVVVGGGNAKLLDELPEGVLLGNNSNAFKGGFRIWDENAPARIAM